MTRLAQRFRYLGVDEVARAKGQYAATLLEFLNALSQECADGIEALAIDMGLAYSAVSKKGLLSAAIVFCDPGTRFNPGKSLEPEYFSNSDICQNDGAEIFLFNLFY